MQLTSSSVFHIWKLLLNLLGTKLMELLGTYLKSKRPPKLGLTLNINFPRSSYEKESVW